MINDSKIEQALQKLVEGNKRYFSSKQSHPNQDMERRKEVSKGQKPFAVIVGCSDSRIPPEIIFDQGLGDLFVIRVAGNIVDDVALGSIEYAVGHLGSQLVVVLGHSKCGAVTATVQGGEVHGHIGSIVKAIMPAVERAKAETGDLTDNSIKANALLVADQIKSSQPILSEMVRNGKIEVVSAYYDIDSGEVTIL
ncbi:MAG: carbonic anhydrase [Syntrophus sp. (in: bacteria)]|nr:carbonic anhydrase [Syntrophus sp. (in: bacteria)]